MDKKFGIKHVVAMGIGTALFVVLTNVQIPVGFIPNTALQTRAAVLAFFSGIIVGLFAAKYKVKEGSFGGKEIGLFNIVQVVANALAWILVAPVLDIVIYAEPVKKVFTQGVTAFVANVIIIGILGTLLLVAYSKVGAKSGSLSKED